MTTTLEFTAGDRERHHVLCTWDQFTGRMRISVDGDVVVNTLRMFSVRRTASYDFTVGDTERHAVRITKDRPVTFAAFRPQPITASVDGREVARAEGTMRRGQTVGIGIVVGALFVGGMAVQLLTGTH